MTDLRKDYYEKLIDNMMIEGIKGMDDAETLKLKEYLQNSNIAEKRSKILAVLVDNNFEKRKLFSLIQKEEQKYNENKDYRMTSTKHVQNVIKMLREYVEFGDVEVKTLGEVMTPISLVEEMLDTLPDSVWTNPSLKWLDPCNGAGIFISIIVQRLLKGLVNFIPEEDRRYKYIMENMIYVGEIQPKNMFLYLYAFDPKGELDLNIYCGSYLTKDFDQHMKDTYGVEKFDIIVMNPPYQELKEGFKKSQPLWNLFVKKVLETSLIEGGYLVAVHPSGWRKVDGHFKNIQMLLKNRQMISLEIHDTNDGLKTFGATTRYDFYCLRNSENQGNFNTKIKCQDGTIERADLSKMEFIPNGMFCEIQKLIAKKNEENVETLANSMYHHTRPHMSKVKTEEFKYPCIDNINTRHEIGNLYWSNINSRGHFGIPKIILGCFGINTFIDETGKYGLTEHGIGIIDTIDNLKRIETILNKDFFKTINKMTDVSGIKDVPLNHKVIALFRKDFWIDFLE